MLLCSVSINIFNFFAIVYLTRNLINHHRFIVSRLPPHKLPSPGSAIMMSIGEEFNGCKNV